MGRLWPSRREAQDDLREALVTLRQPRTLLTVIVIAAVSLVAITTASEPWSSLAVPLGSGSIVLVVNVATSRRRSQCRRSDIEQARG